MILTVLQRLTGLPLTLRVVHTRRVAADFLAVIWRFEVCLTVAAAAAPSAVRRWPISAGTPTGAAPIGTASGTSAASGKASAASGKASAASGKASAASGKASAISARFERPPRNFAAIAPLPQSAQTAPLTHLCQSLAFR